MKKIAIIIALLSLCFSFYAQNNTSVNLDDNVYEILRSAEIQNLCEPLSNVKPYTYDYIIKKLNEIRLNLEEDEKYDQMEIIDYYLNKYNYETGVHLNKGYINISNRDVSFPSNLIIYDTFKTNFGTGIYADNNQNSIAFEIYDLIGLMGNLGQKLSYSISIVGGGSRVPLELLGDDYSIGTWLYNRTSNTSPRTIKTFRNNSFLPYRYSKFWDGSCYHISAMDAGGLEGWADSLAMSFGMSGEIHLSLYENAIELGIARKKREWGAMDNGSSLILNSHARPFLAAEASFKPFKFLSLSTLTGIMEMPHQEYINKSAWYLINEDGSISSKGTDEDSFFFQNALTITMVNLKFKNFQFDFGSTSIWPKRLEFGYAFPLIDKVVYQNNIGDNDNIGVFTNTKFILPEYGSAWLSLYLDEIDSFTTKFWEKTRAMFAFQTGIKANIPKLPFATIAFRYTKVEPYCYTHHSINYTPWYNHYVSESYTNNGECIGYYLAPNSDEFYFCFDSNPSIYSKLNIEYQLIRHGVDWGSGAVPGSNLYSELPNDTRDDMYKYFLKDGTYEWTSVIAVNYSYNLRKFNLPASVNIGLGYIYDWFTQINGEPGPDAKFEYVNNEEYKKKNGVVFNLGMSFLFE